MADKNAGSEGGRHFAQEAQDSGTGLRAAEAHAYADRRRGAQKKARRRTAIFIAAAAVLLVAAGLFAGQQLLPKTEEDAPAAPAEDASPSQESQQTTAPAANDGRITMTLGGDADTYLRRGEDYVDGGCYAYDRDDGAITDKVTSQGSVDSDALGDYTVTYTVEDSAGMVAEATRTVHVVDEVDGGWDTDGISVFMYHDVYDAANPPEGATDNQNDISSDMLGQQLAWLNGNGFYYPSWAEVKAYIDGAHSLPAKSVVLTFDDGAQGFLAFGAPLLSSYQIPATSFLITSDADIQQKMADNAGPYLIFQSHSHDMHRAGYTKKGHGGRIFDMTEQEIADDLAQSADILKTKDAFAYPYGDVSDAAPAAVADAGFSLAFTTQYGQIRPGDDPAQLKRMRIFGTYPLSSFISQADGVA